MTLTKRILATLGLSATLAALAGCQALSPSHSNDFVIIDLVDEFSLDQPGDSWQLTTPDAWRIQADGQRRFLYVLPRPVGQPGAPPAPESAVHGKYRFRNFSLSCWVRLERFADGNPCNASIVFGRQDDRDCLRLDLSDFYGKPDIAIVRVEDARVTRLASAKPASGSDFIRKDWHQVGVLRNLANSTIEVYVDEGSKPLLRTMTAANEWGSIALASTTGGAAFGRVMISGQARAMP